MTKIFDVSGLHSYQLNAIEQIKLLKKCNLYADPGTGKTVITLTLIEQLYSNFAINSALIIAPLLVANNTWHAEIAKWEHLKHLTYSIVTGLESERHKVLEIPVDITIINRENLLWLYLHGHRSFDVIIVDESTSFKNGSKEAAKVFEKQNIYNKVKKHFNNCTFLQFNNFKINKFVALTKMNCKYMVNLTGTPSPNGMKDIWSQIYLLDKGLRLGKNITEYLTKYFYKNYNGFGHTVRNAELIFEQIKDITIRIKNEDYLELPDKLYLITYVDLGRHKKEYDDFEEHFFIELKGQPIVALSAGVLCNKLLQFCNGGMYDDNKNYKHIHDLKLEALKQIIESFPDENILVAYNYKSDLQNLQKCFKYGQVICNDNIIDWNSGKIKLLFCHPASAGKGLNLQHGGRIIVWFGLTWNLEDYLQFNARIYRQGQCKPVIIQHIIAKGCIDEFVMESLENKNCNQNNLLNYMGKN